MLRGHPSFPTEGTTQDTVRAGAAVQSSTPTHPTVFVYSAPLTLSPHFLQVSVHTALGLLR